MKKNIIVPDIINGRNLLPFDPRRNDKYEFFFDNEGFGKCPLCGERARLFNVGDEIIHTIELKCSNCKSTFAVLF